MGAWVRAISLQLFGLPVTALRPRLTLFLEARVCSQGWHWAPHFTAIGVRIWKCLRTHTRMSLRLWALHFQSGFLPSAIQGWLDQPPGGRGWGGETAAEPWCCCRDSLMELQLWVVTAGGR
ncbi:uncharacterized protein [Physcomitrium patens]|uniref:uncharacterized protein n=1 Tax=Physcomitrium patens TaxID=3218 RepID=UPI003CCDCBEC